MPVMSCSRGMITLLLGPLATIGTYTNRRFMLSRKALAVIHPGCGRRIPQKLTRSLSTPMTNAKSLLVSILRPRLLNLLVLATMSMASLLHSEETVSWGDQPRLAYQMSACMFKMRSRCVLQHDVLFSQRDSTPRHRG